MVVTPLDLELFARVTLKGSEPQQISDALKLIREAIKKDAVMPMDTVQVSVDGRMFADIEEHHDGLPRIMGELLEKTGCELRVDRGRDRSERAILKVVGPSHQTSEATRILRRMLAGRSDPR